MLELAYFSMSCLRDVSAMSQETLLLLHCLVGINDSALYIVQFRGLEELDVSASW